jgi:hypothetical protein
MHSRFSRLCLPAALALTTAGALPAQRSLGLAAGPASIRQYNQLASPLNYGGGGTVFTLGYFADSARSAWAVQLDAQFGQLSPADADALGSHAFAANLRLGVPVLRQVAGAAEGRNVRIGVALVGDLFFRDHTYGNERGGEAYADAFVGFDGVVRGSTTLRRATRVSIELAAPVVRVAWRTPYAGLKYAPAPQLALPDRYRGLEGELLLQRAFSTRWSWSAGVRVSALSDHGEWTLQQGTQRLALGLRRRIGGAQ